MFLSREVKLIIKNALKEDIGARDVTTFLTFPSSVEVEAVILAKEKGLLCGMEVVREIFKKITFEPLKKDGDVIKKNEVIARIKGDVRVILCRERVVLNFLSRLSGIATCTREFVDRARGTGVKIMDTRKTTPNLRILEKYAVKVGGGYNHRRNLSEGILIKDNHLKAERFFSQGRLCEKKLKSFISYLRGMIRSEIEVEVENLRNFKKVARCKPDIVMLDNFSLIQVKKAVILRDKYFPKLKLEVSGRMNLANVREFAKTGVDFISVGMLTHSPRAIDFSLEIK